MGLQIKVDERISEVEVLSQDNNKVKVNIDGRIYDLDVERVHEGSYSILHKNKSYNIDLLRAKDTRNYQVSMAYSTYDVSVIDAQAKYLENRNKNQVSIEENSVSSPMPGKVVKLLVNQGDIVHKGQAVVVISAMKMESEYKAGMDGTVTKVSCSAGDTIEAHQPLLWIE